MELLKKFVRVKGMGNSPAAVNMLNNTCYINEDRINDFSPEGWLFILEHENGHLLNDSYNEFEADRIAINRRLFAGASMKEILGQITKFLHFDNDLSKSRLLSLKNHCVKVSGFLMKKDYDYTTIQNRITAMQETTEDILEMLVDAIENKDSETAIQLATELRDISTEKEEIDYYNGILAELNGENVENVAFADGRKRKRNAFSLISIPKNKRTLFEDRKAKLAKLFSVSPKEALSLAKNLRNESLKPHISHLYQEVINEFNQLLAEKGEPANAGGLKGLFTKKGKGTASTPQTGKPAAPATNPPPKKKGPIASLLANVAANKERKETRKDLKTQANAEAKIKRANAKELKAVHGSNPDNEEKKGKWADGVKAVTNLAGGIVGAIYPGTGPLIAEGGNIASELIRGQVKDENGNVVENPSEAQLAAQMQADMEAEAKLKADESAKKKKTMWLIVGGVVTLVLVIGGVVFYFMKKGKATA